MQATIKRPKFYEFLGVPTETTRRCSAGMCPGPGEFVGGHYTIPNNGRRVRVWVCKAHKPRNPLQELPVPAWILQGIAEEEARLQQVNREYRARGNTDDARGMSVRPFASSGHGPVLTRDRVKSWRWGV